MLYKTADGKLIEILRKNYKDDVTYYQMIIEVKRKLNK
jgi:hypothetical protein